MDERDLFAALDRTGTRRPKQTFQTDEERKAAEKRRGTAISRAKTALTRLYPDEYRTLYHEALRRLEEEEGIT